MLIDDLMSGKYIENLPPKASPLLRARLAAAAKFELAPDFAAVAESIATNIQVIAHTLPFCRLPFREVWIEVAQQSRPLYSKAAIHIPEVQGVPHRVGFLLSATRDDFSSFKAHQYWSMASNGDLATAWMAMQFDPHKAPIMPVEGGRRIFKIDPSPEWTKASPEVKAMLNAAVEPVNSDYPLHIGPIDAMTSQGLYEISAADWAGESFYVLAVLGLLNTVNAADRQHVDHAKLNKARAKSGKLPLANHYRLIISSRLKSRIYDSDGQGHRNLRSHMVRGHWKTRRTGIYFWRPYIRGKVKPTIDKTYVVKT